MTNCLFPGVNLAISTPFDDRGAVDMDRFAALIERYIAAGVDGFVLSSGTGMHVYLSEDESQALIRQGADIIAGRAKVIAQTSALLPGDVVRRSVAARQAGADGLMVLPPFFEGPTDDDGIFAFYQQVNAVGLPIIGYNVPAAVGVEISPVLLIRLATLENFHTVKDSSGDFIAQARLIATGVPMINGGDPLALYALYAGVGGLIWGGANFAPRSCVALARAAAAQNWAEAREVWARLEPAMSLIWQGDYVQSVYAAAQIMGYDFGTPRSPLAALSPDRLPALEAALEPLMEFETG
ncbi:MAG: dihydrodipicolinate synthase family protein [Rhodobacteraceae bacterium]|nr:dihydrodipicolinate synthase family protein [Paracoccaceae bacterium]